ncbi:hypothetical protein [Pseudoxanthomonas sp. UTMC 1351]|uniref:hypothetical protein n=1 Tax=Pseudoxanthomonas sp. UTMC 1351 TaxID=2695853 RepID=UPI0034CD7C07
MNRMRFVQRAKLWFWILLFVSYGVVAASAVIDTLSPKYRNLTHVSVTSVQSPEEVRILGAAQAAAVYRASSGTPFSALPPGSTFKIVWPDGSSETIMIVDPKSAAGVTPVGDTQQAATGNR